MYKLSDRGSYCRPNMSRGSRSRHLPQLDHFCWWVCRAYRCRCKNVSRALQRLHVFSDSRAKSLSYCRPYCSTLVSRRTGPGHLP